MAGIELSDFMEVPFDEGIADLFGRNPVFENNWLELGELYSRQNVFGITRSMDVAVTEKINLALAKHLQEGRPADDFIRIFTGEKSIRNATAGYAQTVYRTNLNTAFNSGRMRQARRMPNFALGLEFQATTDPDVRDNHLAVDGLIAPVGSPHWDIFHPPLGFNCRCSTRIITRVEADRKGWLDPNGNLIPRHPKLGVGVTVSQVLASGGRPDSATFGRRPT